MPHQFMIIKCKRCGEWYCPVCKEKCPKCGEVDIADAKTMNIRKQMRRHMNCEKKQSMEEKIKKVIKILFSKEKSEIDKFYDKLYSRRFPRGQKQIDREVEELKEISKGKLSSDEVLKVLTGTAVLFAMNLTSRSTMNKYSKTQDEVVEYIMKKTNQKLNKEEARELFGHLQARYIKNLKDSYSVINDIEITRN